MNAHDETRRCLLRSLAAGAALAACGRSGALDARPSLPLASVPDGGRAEILVGDHPVEIRRDGATVFARSLRCTHMGCRVQWNPGARRYRCPCHEGTFDAEGAVFSGPPPAPLRSIRAEVEGDRIRLGMPP